MILAAVPMPEGEPTRRSWMRRHPVAVTVAGTLIVTAALTVGLWS